MRRLHNQEGFPSSDEEGWRSERRGGAERLVRRTKHAQIHNRINRLEPYLSPRFRGPEKLPRKKARAALNVCLNAALRQNLFS